MEQRFKVGQMVLFHTPELVGKLDSIWERPYEVTQIISSTTYQLLVPERRCKSMIVHVNRLKEWKDPRPGLYRVRPRLST